MVFVVFWRPRMKDYTLSGKIRSSFGVAGILGSMNSVDSQTTSKPNDGAALRRLPIGFLQVFGRDRAKYLQGQISNDVLAVAPGQSFQACLLNNTGHLLAMLTVYIFDDYLLIATDRERVTVVSGTLERFIVRERVEISECPLQLITVQGEWARRVVEVLFEPELPSEMGSFVQFDSKFGVVTIINNPRLLFSSGFDLLVQPDSGGVVMDSLLGLDNIGAIDNSTWETLRIEAGVPAWGAELDESIIPLEAGLDDAISYSKGCYMGQEVIARIHSRGHTNRSMVGLRSAIKLAPGNELTAVDGEKAGHVVGRTTSTTVSPTFGHIGLGYVRNEYVELGSSFTFAGAVVTVTSLPFINES
jgi:folate-binding protein YgfZ